MTNERPPSPGWYRVSDGSTQWWNGQAWSAPPPGVTQPPRGAALPPTSPQHSAAPAAAPHPSAPLPSASRAAAPQPSPPTVVHHLHQTPKSVGVAYAFALLLGEFGAHRFYLGRPVSAIIQMVLWLSGLATVWLLIGFITLVPAVIWWIIDLCILPGMVRGENARRLGQTTAALGAPGR